MSGRSWAAPDAVDWGAEGSCVVPSAPRHSTDRKELERLIEEQQQDMRAGATSTSGTSAITTDRVGSSS